MQMGSVIYPVSDIFTGLEFFLVWQTNDTRQGIAQDRMAREAQPKRFLGVRKTKDGAINLAKNPPPEIPKPRIKHGLR